MELRLFYMGPVSRITEEQSGIIQEFINAQVYACIATNNSEIGARISNLNNMPGQKLNELFYATEISSQKIANIKADSRCEVMYTDGNSQIMLSGKMEIITDPEIKKAKWVDEMLMHYPEGPEDNSFCVLKFVPDAARIMIA